jgi:PAS domain S-box-containing protein
MLSAYLTGLAAIAAALAGRYVLNQFIGAALPSVTAFAATAMAQWYGERRVSIPVAILSFAGCLVLLPVPPGRTAFDLVGGAVGVAAYALTAAVIIAFGEAARAAERRAHERGETLHVTMASIGDGVITTDVQGRVVTLNPVAQALTGWPQSEAAGQPLATIFHIVNEDTHAAVESPATRALRDGTIVGLANHTLLVRRDGSECAIDDSAAPIRDRDGQITGCVLIFRDVTPQRQRERERASQLRMARLAEAVIASSDDAIVRKRLDGTIEMWNPGAERLFGYSASEAIGRHISLVIPPERLAEEDRIIATLRAGERIEHFETERVCADGSRRWVSLTISPITDEHGVVIAASKIVRDVTGRRLADAERERFADNLRRLASELSEADRRKNEFLALLAHELRNPLAPISNAVRALRLRQPGDEQTVLAAADMLERHVAQMARLVNDLLDASRISRGKIELRRSRVAIAGVVEEALETVRPLAGRMGHELSVVVPPEPLYVDGDAGRLAQVIGNLLNNACKFTNRGGRISLHVSRDGAQAVIRVRDDGIGIAADDLPGLFEMFVQVDTSLERSRDGLGIGLTLVKTLVELHGGSIEARSDGPGHGSEFIVRLPATPVGSDAPTPEPPAPAPAPAPGRATRRVLVVDDNVDAAESLAMVLTFDGHEARQAHDGAAAVAVAEQFRPDVVLLDIGLPVMNGYEACRRLRQQPWGQSMLLVALTGWGQEEDREQSRDAGFDVHMVKPVDHELLLDVIARSSSRLVS